MVDVSIQCEVKRIDEQIAHLQYQRTNLIKNEPLKRYLENSKDAFVVLVKSHRIDVNALVQRFQLYPLDIAYHIRDKETFETLLREGANNSKIVFSLYSVLELGSWYSFFKFYNYHNKRHFPPKLFHLLFIKMHLLPDDIIIRIFSENSACTHYEDLKISSCFFEDVKNFMIKICEKMSCEEIEKELNILFENLIKSKRYNVINVVTDYLFKEEPYCEYDEIIFSLCIKYRDFEALQQLRPLISSNFLQNVEMFYNDDFLDSDVKEFVENNLIYDNM